MTSDPYEYPAIRSSGVLSPSYVGAVQFMFIVLPRGDTGVEAVGDNGAEFAVLWEGIVASTCSTNDGGGGGVEESSG